jgi:magnesium transporter
MLTSFIRFGDGQLSTASDPDTLRKALEDTRAVFWLDMNEPSDEEYGLLDEVFGFHPLAIEDTIAYNQRPKIEQYNHVGDTCRDGYFYMVIHGPDLETFKQKLQTKELDMFVSHRYLLTIHEKPMKSVREMVERAKGDPHIALDPGIDMLLHGVLDHLVDHYQPIFDWMQEELDDLEDAAMENPSTEVLSQISNRKRELMNLRRIIGPQRDIMAMLTRGDVPFIREHSRVYYRDILDHLNRAVETIEIYRDLIQGARDIYMSSINNNLNQIMKTLTVISILALPMAVVTSFFGMNFEDMPLLHSAAGLWISMGVTLAIEALLVFIFLRKRWI